MTHVEQRRTRSIISSGSVDTKFGTVDLKRKSESTPRQKFKAQKRDLLAESYKTRVASFIKDVRKIHDFNTFHVDDYQTDPRVRLLRLWLRIEQTNKADARTQSYELWSFEDWRRQVRKSPGWTENERQQSKRAWVESMVDAAEKQEQRNRSLNEVQLSFLKRTPDRHNQGKHVDLLLHSGSDERAR